MNNSTREIRFILNVGITGHRFFSETGNALISGAIYRVIDMICKAVLDTEARHSCFSEAERPLIRAVSSLAEGADRMLVKALLEKHGSEIDTGLICPLPFPRKQYAADFITEQSRRDYYNLLEKADSIVEMQGMERKAEEAYLAAGKTMLDMSDILVAVWDGEQARGPGGTGDIVAEANRRGIPVFWINTSNGNKIEILNSKYEVSGDETGIIYVSKVVEETAAKFYQEK